MKYPKLSLAIDNCFLSKRYTRPADWMRIVKEIGLSKVELSADTEFDPMYGGMDHCARYIDEILSAGAREGVEVVNVYSGHGTYTTLGLAHTSSDVAVRIRDEWVKKQAQNALRLNAGLGFFAHAFDASCMQDGDSYRMAYGRLVENLSDVARYCKQIGLRSVAVEQMYSPHQVPFTVKGAERLIREVKALSGAEAYITVDTGHVDLQKRFIMPTGEDVERAIKNKSRIWVGTERADKLLMSAMEGSASPQKAADEISKIIKDVPFLFSEEADVGYENWLRALAPYSPIVHLQQTDGRASAHKPFTRECNESGIITAEGVIAAIAEGYERMETEGAVITPCEEIVLTLELFTGTAENVYKKIDEAAESVAYWRKALPRDGMNIKDIKVR